MSQEAVQLHGGMGMTEELKVSHTFRRLTHDRPASATPTTTWSASPRWTPSPRAESDAAPPGDEECGGQGAQAEQEGLGLARLSRRHPVTKKPPGTREGDLDGGAAARAEAVDLERVGMYGVPGPRVAARRADSLQTSPACRATSQGQSLPARSA